MSNTQQNHGCRLTISSDTKCNVPKIFDFRKFNIDTHFIDCREIEGRKPEMLWFKKRKRKKREKEERKRKIEKENREFEKQKIENFKNRTEQKEITEQQQNLTIRSGTTYNNK